MCDISWEGIDKLKKAVEARREKGVPIEVERGSGAVEFFNYPFTNKSGPFNFHSKLHIRSIFNVPSVTESTGSIKDCFNAIGRNPAIFDEYGIDDHDGADKLSESDIVALLPVDIERTKFRFCICKEFLSAVKSDSLPRVCRNMDDIYIQGVRRGINDKTIKYVESDSAISDTLRLHRAQEEVGGDLGRDDTHGAEL